MRYGDATPAFGDAIMNRSCQDGDAYLESAVRRQLRFAREVLVPSDAVFRALHSVGDGAHCADAAHFKGPVQDATAKRLRNWLETGSSN